MHYQQSTGNYQAYAPHSPYARATPVPPWEWHMGHTHPGRPATIPVCLFTQPQPQPHQQQQPYQNQGQKTPYQLQRAEPKQDELAPPTAAFTQARQNSSTGGSRSAVRLLPEVRMPMSRDPRDLQTAADPQAASATTTAKTKSRGRTRPNAAAHPPIGAPSQPQTRLAVWRSGSQQRRRTAEQGTAKRVTFWADGQSTHSDTASAERSAAAHTLIPLQAGRPHSAPATKASSQARQPR